MGAGTEEADLAVLTLLQASREPPKERGGRRGRLLAGGGAGGLPTTLLGRPAKANSTGQFLERDVGVSEVGKELAKLNS